MGILEEQFKDEKWTQAHRNFFESVRSLTKPQIKLEKEFLALAGVCLKHMETNHESNAVPGLYGLNQFLTARRADRSARNKTVDYFPTQEPNLM